MAAWQLTRMVAKWKHGKQQMCQTNNVGAAIKNESTNAPDL
jgi:hypothetical protein